MANNGKESKYARIFAELADLKERVVKIEVHEENEKVQLQVVSEKLDQVTCTLHEVIGRESVRASIYGVIGSIVSGIVVWIVTLIRNS